MQAANTCDDVVNAVTAQSQTTASTGARHYDVTPRQTICV